MGEDTQQSIVELSIGSNDIHLEGGQEFVSDQLETIIDEIELNGMNGHSQSNNQPSGESNQSGLYESDQGSSEQEESKSDLAAVAESLGTSYETLRSYFFVDDDGQLHLENPLKIDPKYALLGFLAIENERSGQQVFQNTEMKKRLVTKEGIDLNGSWGSDLIYNARSRGDIRDDPNTDQERNKPFRLTRDGRDRFIDWLNEDD